MKERKTNIEFGKRFTEIVENSRFKSTELVKMAQISKNSISECKKGHVPTAETLCKLSQLLGTTCEYLLTGKEPGELTNEEQKIVDCYRKANQEGRRTIMHIAEMASAQSANNDEETAQISTSAVG